MGQAGGRDGEGLLKSSSQPWEGRVRNFDDVHDLHVANTVAVWTQNVPHRALVFKRFLSIEIFPHMIFLKTLGEAHDQLTWGLGFLVPFAQPLPLSHGTSVGSQDLGEHDLRTTAQE